MNCRLDGEKTRKELEAAIAEVDKKLAAETSELSSLQGRIGAVSNRINELLEQKEALAQALLRR